MRTFDSVNSRARVEKIQALLSTGPKTAQEIADGVFMTLKWAREWLDHLIAIEKVHVSGYRPYTYQEGYVRDVKLFAWGPGKPATKPKPYTSREIEARFRKNLSQEALDRRNALRRARRNPIIRDPMVAALFGGK